MIFGRRTLRRYQQRIAIVERIDGEVYRGQLAGVFADHILLRGAEWMENVGEQTTPRPIPGEYVIPLPVAGIQLRATDAT